MGKKSKKKKGQSKGEKPAASSSTGSNVPTSFHKGDRVALNGLKSAGYNGKFGTIFSVPKSTDGRYGVLLDGADAPIAIQAGNIVLESSKRKSTRQQREERDRMQSCIEKSESETMNADQMAMMRMMRTMFMSEENEMKVFGRRIVPMPDFCSEIMNQGLPSGVDREWANKYLRLAFEQASALPHMFELVFKQKDYQPAPADYLKRLGTNDPVTLKWYCDCRVPGSINQQRPWHAYADFIRHSFSNQSYRKEALHGGTTHVAVGFVDLGILFASELHEPPENCSGPLRFIGVECSAYSVAKTHVIWEMLKQTPTSGQERQNHLRSIMQVWFSATWSEGTEKAVRSALLVLTAPGKSYPPVVSEMLFYWKNASTLSLSKARDETARATTNAFSTVGDLVMKHDRIAIGRYELSRDFLGTRDAPVCGNILMFDCPDGTPPLANDESVFSAFNWGEIVNLMNSLDSSMTVIQAAETYALSKIGKIASWATSNAVTVELHYGKVQDMIDDIASWKPWTMSWSNICDYCDYEEFHNMARFCSVHGDTIHFGYSMNWVTSVYGANIIDFAGESFVDLRTSILEASSQSAEACYRMSGWDQYLRLPPPTNPINTASHFCLEHQHFRKWCSYFFDLARRRGPCSVANVEHAFATSPLSVTGASTVAFTWTYDPAIKFNNLETW